MKKKILFVMPSLNSGGAEKSLISVLSLFDYERYDVDLLLFRHEGLFFDKIPKRVKLLSPGENFNLFDGDAANAVKSFLKNGRLDLAAARVKYGICLKNKDSYKREKGAWREIKKSIDYPKERYDCVIGYLEGLSDWFASDFLGADKKIGYMHSYLDRSLADKKFFGKTVKKFDFFVAVSPECKQNLEKSYPDYKNFCVIENITSPKLMPVGDADVLPNDGNVRVLTVGRLSHEKGPDIAVEACRILKEGGAKIKWYHVGGGPEKDKILQMIKEYGLENYFILLGEKSDPYPYFSSCDIYVQPSRHEGKSIAVDEAKCFLKPIVVTDFPSAYDQINDGTDGIICKTNASSVADAVKHLAENEDERLKLKSGLLSQPLGNEEEILKLYELIEK